MTHPLPLFRAPGPHGVTLCEACRRIGGCRLGVTTEVLDGDTVRSELVCPVDHEGGRLVAHGGWTAAAMDELVGHVPLLRGVLAVTGTLTVRFVRPVPIERPLRGTATLVRTEGSRWYVGAELVLGSSGAVLATAEAVMVLRDPGHFDRHQTWLAEQEGAP